MKNSGAIVIAFYKQSEYHLSKIIKMANENKDFNFHIAYNNFERDRFKKYKNTKNLFLYKCKNNLKKIGKLNVISKHIKSKFIQILDPDDDINFSSFRKFIEKSKDYNNDYELIFNSFNIFLESSQSFIENKTKIKNKKIKIGDRILSDHPLQNAGVIYSKKLFIKSVRLVFKYFDEIIAQDIILAVAAGKILVEKNIDEIRLLDIPFYTYISYDLSLLNTYNSTTFYSIENMINNKFALNVMLNFKKSPFYNFGISRIAGSYISILDKRNMFNILEREAKMHSIIINVINRNDNVFIIKDETTLYKKEFDFSKWKKRNNIIEDKKDGINYIVPISSKNESKVNKMANKLNNVFNNKYASGKILFYFDEKIKNGTLNTYRRKWPNFEFYSNKSNFNKSKFIKNISIVSFNKWFKIINFNSISNINKYIKFEKEFLLSLNESNIEINKIQDLVKNFSSYKLKKDLLSDNVIYRTFYIKKNEKETMDLILNEI